MKYYPQRINVKCVELRYMNVFNSIVNLYIKDQPRTTNLFQILAQVYNLHQAKKLYLANVEYLISLPQLGLCRVT